MKATTILATVAILLGSVFTVRGGEISTADSLYNADSYSAAAQAYTQILATEGPSAEIYYNLGNAHYRANHLGQAVLAYERALRLDPGNGDARANLEFVRSRIQDRPEDDTSFLGVLQHSIVTSASSNTWAWWSLGCFALIAVAALLYFFSANVTLRKAGFFGGFVLAIIEIYLLTVTFESRQWMTGHDEAVVTVPTTHLTSAPRAARSGSDPVVPIHEGTKVTITDSVATPDDPSSPVWYNVRINKGTSAWVRGTDIERI